MPPSTRLARGGTALMLMLALSSPDGVARAQSSAETEARAVYRAALDELYRSAAEPGLLVITDSVLRFTGDRTWLFPGEVFPVDYKAGPMKGLFPADFTYRIPLHLLTSETRNSLERAGKAAVDSATAAGTHIDHAFWVGFGRRFQRAWGMTTFSEVLLARDHQRALMTVIHACGDSCNHTETMQLSRIHRRWRVTRRVTSRENSGYSSEVGMLRYLGPDAQVRAASLAPVKPVITPSDSAWIADSIALSRAPKDIRGRIVNLLTGRPMSRVQILTIRPEGPGPRTTTDKQGRFVFKGLAISNTFYELYCPGLKPVIERQLDGGAFWPVALDTGFTLTVRDVSACWRSRRARPVVAGELASREYQESPFPDIAQAPLYRAVVDELRREVPTATLVLRPFPALPCLHLDWLCGVPELALLVKEGAIDSVAARALYRTRERTAPFSSSFAAEAGVTILTPGAEQYLVRETFAVDSERRYRGDSASHVVRTVLQAYPRARGITSFSPIAFDSAGARALVQVRVEVPDSLNPVETMLLSRSGMGWRVERRHVEKEPLSGAFSGNACVPARAESVPAGAMLGSLQRLYSLELRSVTGTRPPRQTMPILFRPRGVDSTGTLAPSFFTVIDPETGSRDDATESAMFIESHGRQLQRTTPSMRLHGEGYMLEIRRIENGQIFGSWRYFYGYHFFMDPKRKRIPEPAGYFCAKTISSPRDIKGMISS